MNDSTRAVFLSYASQDAPAAQRICTALRAAGIEVWFDQNALRGGDAWDAAIRKQIKNCALFVPIISSNAHARGEGYFRLEWKLAVDRSHLMARDQPFLLPVVVDDVGDDDDRVPDRFREVQWTRLPAGEAPPEFVERVAGLLRRTDVPADGGVTGASRPAPGPSSTDRPQVSPPPMAKTPSRSRRKFWLVFAVIALGIGVSAWAGRHALLQRSVVPYSIDDRRMTFAVLPLKAPDGDALGAKVAKAMTDATYEFIESNSIWLHAVSSKAVDETLARQASASGIAAALNVHFLLRGSVARADSGYTVTMVAVDGENERVLATRHVAIPPERVTPRWREDFGRAFWPLVRTAVEVEVKRARERPIERLDVRDLSFRAFIDWRVSHRGPDAKGAYLSASELLNRALTLAPEDPLALYLTAEVNLCDCVEAWSTNVAEQQAIGESALEKYLRIDPKSLEMSLAKAELYQLRGRYEESVAIADAVLAIDPDDSDAIMDKAVGLLRLGRAQDAVVLADGVHARYPDEWVATSLAAHLHYATGDYVGAATLARDAVTQMSATSRTNRIAGTVLLTRVAAEARLGHGPNVKSALADFNAAVPGKTTLTSIRQWVHPSAPLALYEPWYEGLRLAGIGN
jgi:tetratricopeptide (TPR) repeat protein